MGAEAAKRYLQDHSIPQLFEGLMTGLIYQKPESPIKFLEDALLKIRQNPEIIVKWDTFVEKDEFQSPNGIDQSAATLNKRSVETVKKKTEKHKDLPQKEIRKFSQKQMENSTNNSNSPTKEELVQDDKAKSRVSGSISPGRSPSVPSRKKNQNSRQISPRSRQNSWTNTNGVEGGVQHGRQHRTSLSHAAELAFIPPDAPIILFMGGPGGGKTKYASKIQVALGDRGLVHICMPELIKQSIARYKDRFSEWRDAAERYQRGELIPNELAQLIVKAEMGRHPQAKAYFLEGFPREAKQVEAFEGNIRPIDMALILDYDEETLRIHMHNRGLLPEVIDRRINEFKQKTLPSAKYFDDQRLLHLIPGEKDDSVILERMQKLVVRAMQAGVQNPIKTSSISPHQQNQEMLTNGNTPLNDEPAASTQIQHVEETENTSSNLPLRDIDDVNSTKRMVSDSPIKLDEAAVVENEPLAEQNNGATIIESTSQAAKGSNSKPSSTPASAINRSRQQSRPATTVSDSNNTKDNTTEQTNETNDGNDDDGQALNQVIQEQSGEERVREEAQSAQSQTKRDSAQTLKEQIINANVVSEKPSTPHSRPNTRQSSGGKSTTSKISAKTSGSATAHKSPSRNNSRPPSSQVSTPKPSQVIPSNGATITTGITSASALKTTDPFPKGLPNESSPVILIIGAPGSTKSKFAQKIAKKYEGFINISLGDLLRKKVLQNPDDELWSKIGQKIDTGELIPMKICRELLYMHIHEVGDKSWGYVIEGYPRTISQAEDIETQLGRLDLAILIDCTEQFCKDTLTKRNQIDKENGTERADDEESVVKTRMGLFKQNTLPMLKLLDDKAKLRVVRVNKIEGDQNDERVFQEIVNAIDNSIFIQDDGNGKSLSSTKQNSLDEAVINDTK